MTPNLSIAPSQPPAQRNALVRCLHTATPIIDHGLRVGSAALGVATGVMAYGLKDRRLSNLGLATFTTNTCWDVSLLILNALSYLYRNSSNQGETILAGRVDPIRWVPAGLSIANGVMLSMNTENPVVANAARAAVAVSALDIAYDVASTVGSLIKAAREPDVPPPRIVVV